MNVIDNPDARERLVQHTPADLYRAGLAPLAVLSNYALVNIADESTWTRVVAATGRKPAQLALGARCSRMHYDDYDDGYPRRGFTQVLCVTADGGVTNLSHSLEQLAAVAWQHEAEYHEDEQQCTCQHQASGPDGDDVDTETDPVCVWHGDAATTRDVADRLTTIMHRIGQECGYTDAELWAPFEVTWDAVADRACAGLAQLAAVRERLAAHADAQIVDPGLAALELVDELRTALGLTTTRAIRDAQAGPEKTRCTSVAPPAERQAIAKKGGLVLTDPGLDWRCYNVPHSAGDGRHTVRPQAGGHMYGYHLDTETETTP